MITDKALIDDYIQWQRSIMQLTEHTYTHTRFILNSWADFLSTTKETKLRSAKPDSLIGYIEKRQNVDNVKDVTIADDLCTIKCFYEYLVHFGGSTNPAGCLPDFVCKKDYESDFLSVDEVFAMLDTCTRKDPVGNHTYCCIALLWSTGLRSSELLNLCWKDLDLEEGTLLVRRGKGIKQRSLFLNDRLLGDLKAYRQTILSAPGNPVFCSFTRPKPGKIAMSSRELCACVASAAHDAHLDKKVTPLMLRHTFATHMYEAGIPIRDIQELMGHNQSTETSMYIHVTATAAKRLLNDHTYHTHRNRS